MLVEYTGNDHDDAVKRSSLVKSSAVPSTLEEAALVGTGGSARERATVEVIEHGTTIKPFQYRSGGVSEGTVTQCRYYDWNGVRWYDASVKSKGGPEGRVVNGDGQVVVAQHVPIPHNKDGVWHRYAVLPSQEAVVDLIRRTHPDQQHFFEHLLTNQAQKPHFDIEDDPVSMDKAVFDKGVERFIKYFLDFMMEHFGVVCGRQDVYVSDGSGSSKHSVHVVLSTPNEHHFVDRNALVLALGTTDKHKYGDDAFRPFIEQQLDEDPDLKAFYGPHPRVRKDKEGKDVVALKPVVDWGVNSVGPRNMKIVGSCKATDPTRRQLPLTSRTKSAPIHKHLIIVNDTAVATPLDVSGFDAPRRSHKRKCAATAPPGGAPPVVATDAQRKWVHDMVNRHEGAEFNSVEPSKNNPEELNFVFKRTNGSATPCRLGGTHRRHCLSVFLNPYSGTATYYCHGDLTGHPVGPDGEKQRWMRLPETLPEALRTRRHGTSEAEHELPADKDWLIEQSTKGDVGYARVYAKVHGRKNVKIIDEKGYGYIWTERTKLWRRGGKDMIMNDIQVVLMSVYEKVAKTIPKPPPRKKKKRKGSDDEEDDPHAYDRRCLYLASLYLKSHRNMLGALRQLSECRNVREYGLREAKDFTERVDAAPFELPTKGGTVIDFKTLAVRARTQDDLWTFEARAQFLPGYDCALPSEVYRVMADEVDHPERKGYADCLRCQAGARLCADKTARALFINQGTNGKNSKSEQGRQLDAVAPEVSHPIEKSLIVKTKASSSGGAPSPHLACLMGMRITTLGDVGNNFVLNEESVRNLVGGDTLYARFLNENPHPFKMLGKPTLNCNRLPKFSVTDPDLREKVKYYPFTHVYKDTPDARALCQSYRTEHLDKFFTYFCYGAHDYANNGLRTCPWLDKERARFLVKINPIGNFVEERCVRTSGKHTVHTSGRELYDAYEAWATDPDFGPDRTGDQPVSIAEFGRLLTPLVGPTANLRIDPNNKRRLVRCRKDIRLRSIVDDFVDECCVRTACAQEDDLWDAFQEWSNGQGSLVEFRRVLTLVGCSLDEARQRTTQKRWRSGIRLKTKAEAKADEESDGSS